MKVCFFGKFYKNRKINFFVFFFIDALFSTLLIENDIRPKITNVLIEEAEEEKEKERVLEITVDEDPKWIAERIAGCKELEMEALQEGTEPKGIYICTVRLYM